MNHAHLNRVVDARGVKLGLISPDGRQGMLDHAAQFAAAGVPFIFDPGQGLPMFNGEELRALVEQASYVAVNDYEGSMLSERTGWSAEQIAARVKALIVTRGGEGSWIYANGEKLSVPVAPATKLADPTGCGDAYRAGLLYGLQRGLDWATTGRVASLAGSIKMEHHGTQQHRYTMAEFAARYRATFGHSL
jgi:adenosine kinase